MYIFTYNDGVITCTFIGHEIMLDNVPKRYLIEILENIPNLINNGQWATSV